MKKILRYKQEIHLLSIIRAFLPQRTNFLEEGLLFNSCRSGLKWLLSFYRKKVGRAMKIGIPCYSCYTVYQSVYESGNQPIILDIDPLCFDYVSELDISINELDVLIWINYFGFKYENILKHIRTKHPKLVIIEDCSHIDIRDFSSDIENRSYSNFSVFSFNFRKPLVSGGGGLTVLSKYNNTELNEELHSYYGELAIEKLSISKLKRLLSYNFCYNKNIYRIFANYIVKSRTLAIDRQIITIQCFKLNRMIKRILNIQFVKAASYNDYKVATLAYFDGKENVAAKFCWGNLLYFPIRVSNRDLNAIEQNVDFYMLWRDLSTQYLKFGINISKVEYPQTYAFLSDYIFVPMQYYTFPRINKALISNLS